MWNIVLAQAETAASQAAPAVQSAVEGAAEGAAQTSGAAPAASPFGSMLPMIVAFIAIMYFLMIRPQQKREKERKNMLNALAKGDKVVTSGGICGTITEISENHVVVKVDDDVKLQFVRSAIVQVVSREGKK
ncbi:MAG TPA: preprotein translocase subunit YajC [Candidatus Hydrogenedentes bacterium]|nr:preprotein translocase subunit YajC [Candidatus Hydrogenedentota bacterium]